VMSGFGLSIAATMALLWRRDASRHRAAQAKVQDAQNLPDRALL